MAAIDTTVKYFDYTMANSPTLSNNYGVLVTLLDAILVNGFGSVSVSSMSVSNGVGTATATGHSFIKNSVALISGATPSGLNGQHKVLSVSGSTFTFDAFGVADGAATGTITASVAPLGWEKRFSGTNKAVYRSSNLQSTRFNLRIDDSVATQYARVVGYEEMTDVDSGTFKFPLDSDINGGMYITKSNNGSNRQWHVFGDDRCFFIGICPQDGATVSSGYTQLHFFGDLVPCRAGDKYSFMIASARNTYPTNTSWYNSPASSINNTSDQTKYLARNCTGVSAPIPCVGISFGTRNESGCWGAVPNFSFPNTSDYSIYVNPIYMYETTYGWGVLRGLYPGVYNPFSGMSNTTIPHGTYLNDFGNYNKELRFLSHLGGSLFVDLTGPWR